MRDLQHSAQLDVWNVETIPKRTVDPFRCCAAALLKCAARLLAQQSSYDHYGRRDQTLLSKRLDQITCLKVQQELCIGRIKQVRYILSHFNCIGFLGAAGYLVIPRLGDAE